MNLRTITAAVFMIAAVAAVPAASASCSNATLNGTYGMSWGWPQAIYYGYQGYAVGQITANGKGSLTGTETYSSNGSIVTGSTFTGTYSIASDCVGTMTLTDGFATGFNFYMDDGNKGFQFITTDGNREGNGFTIAEGPAKCSSGNSNTYAINLVGTIPGSDISKAVAGQVKLNGKGELSGTATISENFSNPVYTVTGTYTEDADCTGTMQIAPAGSSTMNFSTVSVNSGAELLLIETDSGTVVEGTAQK